MTIEIDKATIEFLGEPVDIFEKPMGPFDGAPKEQVGNVQKFRVTTTDTLNMIFGIVTWPQANAEVRHLEYIDGISKYERLENAGRLSLFGVTGARLLGELNVMKYGSKGRPTLHGSSLDELSYLAGSDFSELLKEHGAIAVGSREDLEGSTGRTAKNLSFLVDEKNVEVIAVAFTVTRVLAIMNDLGLE